MRMNDRAEDEVRRYLRAESPLPTASAEDWERLIRRIVSGAEPVLGLRRPRRSWREDLIALGRVGVPMALAAGMAALFLLNRFETAVSTEAAMPSTAFLSAMAGETSRETVLDLTLGEPSQGLLPSEGR